MSRGSARRRGAVLLIVSGLSAILVAMCLAFIVRMRSDGAEARRSLLDAQARTMLTAALQYVAETARLGWDDPLTPEHEEAFGWVDLRDGSPGPKDLFHRCLGGIDPDGGGVGFPAIGGAARCEMHVLARPPCAIETRTEHNPLPAVGEPFVGWRAAISYANLDPVPVDGLPAGTSAAQRRAAWLAGDPAPRPATVGRAWFRVHRATRADCAEHRDVRGALAPIAWSPAVFIVTCGAGATRGYRDWDEVVRDGAEAAFAGDRALFAALRADESILRFACEWHPAVSGESFQHYVGDEDFVIPPHGVPSRFPPGTKIHPKSLGGNLLWLERLAYRPPRW